ncbi:LysR family transcriptional regulator [Ornithobacterium rhinotracheale]|uniref:Transcriptional regulator n=2 Tax=Ornithobacterium rhinotracheale TaxID=28251 RepID=I4A0L3_ORNRL|nr:LysR substrate-binding domain-containing protein [Ornithobacterium rhinotracheale]AFL97497.1 transcriptional regulator [Ornithobacterium rhinotracheale DSM 15997]AIP98964.1 transcriptional regulator [Ornithobacterium rhinotracheale ORT-UMN 88]KGB66902.1 transcriptional regulator [Ornithobacterium rhinotracheale H06-030791]MBN3661943.1 LysR family transcriptional regulator [Ornithobacterium rhinotracheale]MCK0195137.1 LysR substrate-binding domain-containing protein [Ornithobacterium rhinotr
MTLVQLEYALAVAESKNFTLAAEKVFVTQPTLSMQIQKLEAELGVNIFDRTTHPITITPMGEKVLEQAKKILNEAKRMQFMVSEEKNSLEGTFKIGVIPTLVSTLVPLFYKNFINNYPKTQLKVVELKTKEILEQLKEGKIDFGIAATPLNVPDFVEDVLFYEPMLAYVPPQHRLHDKKEIEEGDLDTSDLLLLDEGHCFRNNVLSICSNSAKSNLSGVSVQSGNFETLVKLADDGLGMTVLPSMQADDILLKKEKQNLKNFKQPSPTREISLVYHELQLRLNFARELKKMIQGLVRGKIYLEKGNRTFPTLSMEKNT